MTNSSKLVDKVKKLIDSIYGYMFFEVDINEVINIYRTIIKIDDELFKKNLDIIRKKMFTLIDVILSKDPSINNKEEIILIHPGFFAIFSYRIAHFFYINNEYLLGKIISELAHQKTGIDINPGAIIGDNFFIDHGTGIVIGETSIIGNNVTMFHGVTLGTKNINKICNKKRHPTIEDDVILYSNCTILGGDTIIGKGSIIGSNVVIKNTINPYSVISIDNNYCYKSK